MTDDREEEQLSARQLRRREVKRAGRRSAAAAHTLMLMPEHLFTRLDLDQELREAFTGARAIRNTGARRREERRLAGVLRQGGLDELEALLARQDQAGQADARLFKQVEAWRERLLTDSKDALAEFYEQHPGQQGSPLHQLVRQAISEQTKGKPKGAKRALFRHIAAVLREREPDAQG